MGLGVLSDKQLRQQNLEAHERVMEDRLYYADACKLLLSEILCYGTKIGCFACGKSDCTYNASRENSQDETHCPEYRRVAALTGWGTTRHRNVRRIAYR